MGWEGGWLSWVGIRGGDSEGRVGFLRSAVTGGQAFTGVGTGRLARRRRKTSGRNEPERIRRRGYQLFRRLIAGCKEFLHFSSSSPNQGLVGDPENRAERVTLAALPFPCGGESPDPRRKAAGPFAATWGGPHRPFPVRPRRPPATPAAFARAGDGKHYATGSGCGSGRLCGGSGKDRAVVGRSVGTGCASATGQ
jgi:hypothetical protein